MPFVRRLTGLVLCASVAVVMTTGPMVHAHDDHHSDHHAPGAVHSHFSGHAPSPHSGADGPSAGADDDEQAFYLKLFVAVEPDAAGAIAAVPTFHLRPPTDSAPHQPVSVAHGHDPPSFDRSSPRAPPPFLS